MSEPIPPPPGFDRDDANAASPGEDVDSPCLQCGYDLRGLGPEGACPECGTPIVRSLRGPWLAYANPDYVRTLQRGALLLFIGIVVAAVEVVTPCALSAGNWATGALADLPEQLLAFLASGAQIGGWWMLSTPDPGLRAHDPGGRARVIVRTASSAAAVVWLGGFAVFFVRALALTPALPTVDASLTILRWLLWLVTFFAGISYIKTLARRLGDPHLAGQANTTRTMAIVVVAVLAVSVGLVSLAVTKTSLAAGACGGFAGILAVILLLIIWLVLYLVLVNSVYARLRDARVIAERNAAA